VLQSIQQGGIACHCGCGRLYPMYSGVLTYGSTSSVAFRLAHFDDERQPKHLWLLLGSGPWFEGDMRGCWCVLDNWIADDSVIARVTDADESPFTLEHAYGERLLQRSEVLSKDGALDWAIARREDLIRAHAPTRNFLLGAADAINA
jgi:hypothetical protein